MTNPSAPSPAAPRAPRPVVPNTSKREFFIAMGVGLAVLALVIIGVIALSSQQGKPSTNQLRGTVVAKHYSGEKEKEISFGRKGLKTQETDSGYSLELRVEGENRTYQVPVSKALYDARKVGDKQDFIRPPSEQQ